MDPEREEELHEVDEEQIESDEDEDQEGDEHEEDDAGDDQEEFAFDGVDEDSDDDDPPEAELNAAPVWVKQTRKANRTLKRERQTLQNENEQLKAKIKELANGSGQAQEVPKLGPMPKLEDHNYDEEEYQEAMAQWYATKQVVEANDRRAREEAQRQDEQIRATQERYQQDKRSLERDDFDEREKAVVGQLSEIQHALVLHIADTPARFLYTLSGYPKLAAELAAIKDSALFVKKVAQLETTLRAKKPKRAETKPETKLGNSGAGRRVGSSDEKLKRLIKQAQETGDVTALRRYQAQMEAQGR